MAVRILGVYRNSLII